LALTAHVTEGEIEKCKNAGANDYLSKPFNPKDLFEKIKTLYGGVDTSSENKQENENLENLMKWIDISKLREFTNGKVKLMINTMNVLIEEIPNDIILMKTALDNLDWEKLRSVAHRVKPNFMLVATKELHENVITIEQNAKEQLNLNEIPELLLKLETHAPSLIKELKEEVVKLKSGNE